MRILHLTHQGDHGGSTNSITWLVRGLAERGHEVWLGCRPESLIAGRLREGPVHLVDTRLPGGPGLVREAWRWRAWVDRNRIDVVNAHASLDRHMVSYMRLLGERAALVHTRRNVPLTTFPRVRARLDALTTDRIIGVSREVADSLIRSGIPRHRVAVVRNGLPLTDLTPADPTAVAALRVELALREGVPVVGVVARRKSQEDLLRAARILGRPLELVFAGIRAEGALAELAAQLPEDVVPRFLGVRNDVPELQALFDVLVLPSRIEGFSLALVEAMARGLPCIASSAGGNPEALEDGCGILYPPGDHEALAKALAQLLGDPDASRAMGERARQRALSDFDVARTVQQTEAVYDEARSRRNR